jgi:hypothetical protein
VIAGTESFLHLAHNAPVRNPRTHLCCPAHPVQAGQMFTGKLPNSTKSYPQVGLTDFEDASIKIRNLQQYASQKLRLTFA